MKKFLPIAMAAVMLMSAIAVSAASVNAAESLNSPVQYAQVAKSSLATPKISKAESVYGGVKLTWNKVNGAAKYRVYYKGSKGWTKMVDTTSTTYTDKSVSSGRNYTYTVRCISKDGKKFTSGYDSKGKTVKYVAAPKISKLESVNGGVKISWGKVNGATKYRVYYKGSKGWTKMVDTTSTSYTDKDVSSGRNYTYTVRCISKDCKKFTSGYDSKGKTVKYVAAPKISKIETVYDGTKITWNKVTGAEKYRVYYKDRSGWNKLVDTTGTSIVDTGIVAKELFSNKSVIKLAYTVRCISSDAKKFTSGYDTNGVIAKDNHNVYPYLEIATESNGIKITFRYDLPSKSKYRLYKKENGSWKKLAETYNGYYIDKNVKAGKSYTYTVRCVSKDGKKFTSSYDPYGITLKYKTTNKTRDDFVNYLMSHQNEWLPKDRGIQMLAQSGFEFVDLDFDGVPELIAQESGGTGGNFDAKVYSFKNRKLVQASYIENYIQNDLDFYYNKNSKKYEVIGTSIKARGTMNDHLFGKFQLMYKDSSITTDYFSAYYVAFPINTQSGTYEYTYYNGADGYYRGIGNHKKISKSSYNDIMRNKFANLVNVHKHSQFIYRTEAYNPNWNDMSYAQKKQALLDSYDSFSYDKY